MMQSSAVVVSGVTYSHFQGTSANDQAITLDCCNVGCTNIIMDQINITSYEPGKTTEASCQHVSGKYKSTIPPVPCLSKN